MTDIKELAVQIAQDMGDDEGTDRWIIDYAQRFLAAYLAEQEPVGWFDAQHHDFSRVERIGWKPLFTAPPEPAPKLKRHVVCEEIGCSGLDPDMCNNHPEQCQIVQKVTEPAPQQQKQQLGAGHGGQTSQCEVKSSSKSAVCAAPSSEEVREMVERLRNDETDLFRLQEKAADLIERLAARVPDGCVVVPREP